MAMTGITVPDEIIAEYNDFKLKRTSFKFILYKIDGAQIVVDQRLEEDQSFEDMVGNLTDEPRFILADFPYQTTDGRDADKIVFITWIPDTAKVREKMKYSGTKEALKSAFVGISVNVNATALDELTTEIVVEQCNKV